MKRAIEHIKIGLMPYIKFGSYYGLLIFSMISIFSVGSIFLSELTNNNEYRSFVAITMSCIGIFAFAQMIFGRIFFDFSDLMITISTGVVAVLLLFGIAGYFLSSTKDEFLLDTYKIMQSALFPFGLFVMLLAPVIVARRK